MKFALATPALNTYPAAMAPWEPKAGGPEILRYAQGYGPLMQQFPAASDWLTRCQSRPAFQRMWQERLAEPE